MHKILESAGLAPRYLYEKNVPFLCATLYVIMDYVPWCSLRQWLNSNDPIPERMISNLELALNVLHRNGLVHGDFRPSNILVSDEGEVKIVDFDWSCTSNQKRCYPKDLNSKIVWPASSEKSLFEAHDHFFFASIKSQLRAREIQ